MQLASSYEDMCRGRSTGVGGMFDFLDPTSWFSSDTPSFPTSIDVTPAVSSLAPAVSYAAPVDTSPGFLTTLAAGLPSILSAGAQMYTTTQLMQNPQLAQALLRPAGVTSANNPYGVPSGSLVPAGVSPTQLAYPQGTTFDIYGRPILPTAQKSILSDPVIIAAIIGAAGLLLVATMGRG
jgi:hypothetical protein